MISNEDVIAAYPQAEAIDEALLTHWVDVANVTIDAARVKDPRTLNQAQILFVMHQITKPPLDLKAPAVVARTRQPGRRAGYVKAKHVWAGTLHGDALIKAMK